MLMLALGLMGTSAFAQKTPDQSNTIPAQRTVCVPAEENPEPVVKFNLQDFDNRRLDLTVPEVQHKEELRSKELPLQSRLHRRRNR